VSLSGTGSGHRMVGASKFEALNTGRGSPGVARVQQSDAG
jgi:hypothetical protein